MVGSRDTPPDVQDGPYGLQPGEVSNFDRGQAGADDGLSDSEAIKLARECYDASTNWLNAGRRARWNDNLRAFNSLHPSGSKYLGRDYAHRTSLYRPKTRATIRKAEAKTASAFFSNEDAVSIQPGNPTDPRQVASASLMQALLQYRLTKTIPWFLIITGGRQDADVMGVVAAKAYWKFEERYSHTVERPRVLDDGMLALDDNGQIITDEYDVWQKYKDEPVVDLISPENVRFDPGADWRDPVNSSPYFIEMIPMYLNEVTDKMRVGPNGEEPEWLSVPESALHDAVNLPDDVTRRTREAGRVPGKDHDAWKPRAYDIVWVRENIMRRNGQDWHYYSVGEASALLTKPRKLEEVYLHGIRPYTLGFTVLETHKTYPSGKPELLRDLQRASNDDWNLRFDQLKLALHPRQFVRTGSGLEAQDVKAFIPGKVILTQDPGRDVIWDRPPNVPPEAYSEADRINLDWGDLVGDMDQSAVRSSELAQQSATGMALMSGEAAGIPEYELKLYAITFVEPLIRQLIKLEQAYETDATILGLAGQSAQLFQKFGIDAITDDLLAQELTCVANVGTGATNPNLKLANFLHAGQAIAQLFGPATAMGANFEEVTKEVFGLCGYKDGSRFFYPGFDPRQAMMAMAQSKEGKGAGGAPDQSKVQAAQITSASDLKQKQIELQIAQLQAQIELQKTIISEHGETQRTDLEARYGMLQDYQQGQREDARDLRNRQLDQQQQQQQQQLTLMPPPHAIGRMREGVATKFRNGQSWHLRGGRPERVA